MAGLDFSLSTLIAGLLFSTLGFFIFRSGRHEANFRRVMLGILLMGYGYFVSNPWATWGIGAILVGLNYFSSWING